MSWTSGWVERLSFLPRGCCLDGGELVGRNGKLPGPDLHSGSLKDDFLGAELTDTVIAWYHRKHQWSDSAVRRSASPPSPLATYGMVEFRGYSSGLQSPREQDTQPSSSSLKGVRYHRPSQAGW